MAKRVTVAGAAAIGDYIFHVDHLPSPGQIVKVFDHDHSLIPGGCAPNIAAGMAALERVKPVLCYPVGNDAESQAIAEGWGARDIECDLTHVAEVASGKSWMYMQDDGTTMCFAYAGAADVAEAQPGDLEEWVVICPVFNAFSKKYADEALRQGRKLVFTGIAAKEMADYLPKAKAVIFNRGESRLFCEAAGFRDAADLSARYPELLLYVTNGSRGSSLFRAGAETEIPLIRAARTLDFTGAGDAYTSGVVSALCEGMAPEKAGLIGAAHASFVIENLGGQAVFPTWDALFSRLRAQKLME